MPIYEIEITARKMVCIEAEDEDRALELAEENLDLGWESSDVAMIDEFDTANPRHAEWIAIYNKSGEFYSDEP